MKKLLSICFIVSGLLANAQKDTTKILQQPSDPNQTILSYEQFLREETKQHREFTQEYYGLILKLLSGLSVVMIGVFTWLNWKSKSDIKKQVNEQFTQSVQGIVDDKIKEIDNIIKDVKEKSLLQFSEIERQFQDVNKLLLELSSKSKNVLNEHGSIASAEITDVQKLKGKSILWVDDFPSNNEYPMRILQQAGVKFEVALDTKSAIAILKSKKFDLIISDMSRGNNFSAGLDLLREAKNINISTPIIIFASVGSINKYGKEAIQLGAVEVINGFTDILNSVQYLLLKNITY